MQTRSVTDLLFDLSEALQNPSFASAGEQVNCYDVGASTIRALRDNTSQDQGQYPAPGWNTAIIVNATKTARGSRWEELGAILTHLFNLLSDRGKTIPFVRLTQAPDTADKICGLREAIEHIWNNQPSDSLLGAAKFEGCFLSTSSQLYEIATPHTSLIFMVPDGVMHEDSESNPSKKQAHTQA
jgi:hypothetical protein